MLGTLNPSHKDVTVVGGGIAGLLAAWYLDEAGWDVTLYEKAHRCGGLIQTTRSELGIAEWAAHSLLATPVVMDLCEKLKVPLLPLNDDSKSRYIYRSGKMRKMPLSIPELMATLAASVKAKAPAPGSFSTVEEWCRHHLGQAACDYLLTPFLFGIYGASPSEISLQGALPSMELEEGAAFLPTMLKRRRAARKRPRAVMMVPEKGMESLTNALALQLRESLGSRFHSGQAVETLPDSPNIILCTPANAAAELIGDADTALSAGLRDLSYTPLISCTVFARKNDFKSCPKGVGVLVPAQEQRDCLGILFPSSSFEGRTTSSEMMSFTVMLGGTARPDIIQKSDGDVRNMVAREMKDILGLRGPIQNISVFRHTRAIPLYSPAILDLWQTARSGWCSQPGHLLFGNYTGQVSIRGMMETMHALTHTSDN